MNVQLDSLIYADDLDTSELNQLLNSLTEEELRSNTEDLIYLIRQILSKKRRLTNMIYDSSTEQIPLFETEPTEQEKLEKQSAEEEAEQYTVIQEHIRKKRKSRRESIDQLPVREKDVYPDDPRFLEIKDQCRELAPTICEEIGCQCAEIYNSRTIIHHFAWTDENGDTVIFSGDNPNPKLIPHSYISPSLLAHITCMKTILGLPLYRLEKNFNYQEIPFSRQNLSDWLIDGSERYLSFLSEKILSDFAGQECVHLDETTLKVIQNQSAGGNKKSTMMVGRSGPFEKKQMAVYVYSPTKKQEEFLKILPSEYSGIISCDAASQHHIFKKAELSFCMAHARRKFMEILKTRADYRQYAKLKTREEQQEFISRQKSPGLGLLLEIMTDFARLYAVESMSRMLRETPEQILIRRQRVSLPIFNSLITRIRDVREKAAAKSDLKLAASYFLEHQNGLSRYLSDGRIPIDNNAAERAMKPFVMARKNFLFSNTERGARATAICFTVLQSAVLNGLKPEQYLTYVLDTLRREGLYPQVIERLLPYSGQLPAELYMKSADSAESDRTEKDESSKEPE